MHINEFDYHSPEELIARYPLKNRSDSRLMIVNPEESSLKHETLIIFYSI